MCTPDRPLDGEPPETRSSRAAWARLHLCERDGRRSTAVYPVIRADEHEVEVAYDPSIERPIVGTVWTGRWGRDLTAFSGRVTGTRSSPDPRVRTVTIRCAAADAAQVARAA